jgi:hypothetical protein
MSEASTFERDMSPAAVPNSTCDVAGMLVVQVMVAPERVMLLAARAWKRGGAAVGVMVGVVVMVGMVVSDGMRVRVDVGTRLAVGVAETVAVAVRVAVRMAVGENVGAGVWVAPGVAVAVVVFGVAVFTVGVGVGDWDVVTEVAVGVAEFAGVGVTVRVAVDVGVEVAVRVGVAASCASVTWSGSVRRLATIKTPRRLMSASRLNTGLSECHRPPGNVHSETELLAMAAARHRRAHRCRLGRDKDRSLRLLAGARRQPHGRPDRPAAGRRGGRR